MGAQPVEGALLALRLLPSCPARFDGLQVRYDLFVDRDSGHRGLLALVHGGQTRSAVFTARERVRTFELGVYRWWHPLRDYPLQGIWHIWIGFDHILFLLTLLLPAVLIRRPGPRGGGAWEPVGELRGAVGGVVRVVTAFTVAHSVTLSLSALGLVAPPARLVEVVIAASVVVAALNNVWPIVTRRVWLVAFVFGLVHGFGFANVLQELGMPRRLVLLALFGFNLGVEIGQLSVVAVFLPVAYALRRSTAYRRFGLLAGSWVAAGLAFVWLLERALDRELLAPLAGALIGSAGLVPAMIRHPLVIAGAALGVLAVVLWAVDRRRRSGGRCRRPRWSCWWRGCCTPGRTRSASERTSAG